MINLVKDIISSFDSMPAWVVVWIFFGLVPANFGSLFFLNELNGGFIAFFAIAGIIPNVIILLVNRGFRGVYVLMTVSHILAWPFMFYFIFITLPQIEGGAFMIYLFILMAVDGFSLIFDVRDAIGWLRRREQPY